jgi:tRNA threonylcarbamoyladenosine biosynthesis protein TsaE
LNRKQDLQVQIIIGYLIAGSIQVELKKKNMFFEKVTSLKSLGKTARKLINQFPGQRVFAFYGKMGAGKTTFIQSVCKELETPDNVTSPTFAIINEYKTETGDSIFHFDFYRIKDLEEAFDLGYEDYFYSGNYCLIEWPEKIEALLPQNVVEVKIEVQENGDRHISAKF